MFNLILPSHNGIPVGALNELSPDEKSFGCVLRDLSVFESIVEKELMKCGRTVFADESSKVLLEYKYLKKKYPKVKFFISENAYPLKRVWQFKSEANSPIIYKDNSANFKWNIWMLLLGAVAAYVV